MNPSEMLRRLEQAVNARDLDALTACFSDDYRNETPVHPARGFRGRDQVRSNWRQIFTGVPDVQARVLRSAVDGDVVWSEWEMSGTRRDGAGHLMRGVVIFEVRDGRAVSGRFFLEPVDHSGTDATAAVRAAVGATS